ncbi:ATP-dependent DNA ligase LigD ligase module /ATP-dependent DNA ligase LigD phosphoesterase module /ATP-dependent DNA ligase LigD polymerase module [Isoptericola sp. CG 20/1183]|uniref:DNA ligase (ATP) n=1 Tax=Isoptericola halotolerans TaxID=300560 RepID=A0ABX5EEQ7_9MICO|nr:MULTISPECIES: ATP-dependent DNA ligase [Isoptericola]PRZ05102.1 ATP-dependent DNA ligase LigD ligase module /ATP-dependent DNA ligase LigD phosphoesterase module /ATP-dependent DNA ligase LigD polymerase module [Isoptericola halotolerans]PRZ05840.1 ATP-dependent DNA ligase LigD ligase module /ATP-dependent DNA ligase LigD phosphoesterase module /ATP-dependent DNA ligase LigD polymerase module [Isoptericola sp. CG 20/1183]
MAAADAPRSRSQTVSVEGHRLQLTNLDKVLYPATGTTKGEVLRYLAQVAPALVAHAAHRPATRKRWPNGVTGQMFFQKNLDASTPEWVPRRTIRHTSSTNDYVLVDDLATLTWLGQTATLEIHTPQWQFGRTGTPLAPDRLVLDLDPGPGAGLAECAEVARLARDILVGMNLEPLPVTSGSKGIHLYAALTAAHGELTSDDVSAVAKELARHLESARPGLVVSDMKKSLRQGKVLVDWSQNNGSKTTIAPYSLRGREEPTVAAPRTWDELEDPDLRQLGYAEVLERLEEDGDLLAPLLTGHLSRLEPTPERLASFQRLGTYRSKRDPGRTPEPFGPVTGSADPRPEGSTGSAGSSPRPRDEARPSFVVQEHHARRLHWDFRLEHDGVLVSWALPKGEPTDPAHNHLAVQTEDHPLEYGSFEGTIPAGEYGAGEVTIWDAGTYELEKWREGKEVIVTLDSPRRGRRRLALIQTGGRDGSESSWLIHRTKAQPDGASAPTEEAGDPGTPVAQPADRPDATERTEPSPSSTVQQSPPGAAPRPMLATTAAPAELARMTADDWAFEAKWDGFRAIVEVLDDARVRLTSRSGRDLTATFPELAELGGMVPADELPLVLDGEIVALDAQGRPSFRRLQQRANLARPRDVERARRAVGVDLVLFDVLRVAGVDVTDHPYDERRRILARVVDARRPVHVPEPLPGDATEAMAESRRLGLEGLVAKRRRSGYAVGRRSRDWLRAKHVAMQEAVVVGWRPLRSGTPTEDPRSVGGLLLAVPDDAGDLRFVGRVGTGLSDAERRRLAAALVKLEQDEPPVPEVPALDAAGARWVRPTEVVEVSHAGWTDGTPGGGSLRHAVWRGRRTDKRPQDIRVE